MGEGSSRKPLTHSRSWAHLCALSRTELGPARVQRLSRPKSDESDFGWERAREARLPPRHDFFTGSKAGTHIPEAVVMGPRFRGDDSIWADESDSVLHS